MNALRAASVGVGLLFVAAILGTARLSAAGFGWADELGFAAFGRVCHQLPGRSFHLWGRQLPVCARCLGVYLGMLLGAVAYPRLSRMRLPFWTVLAVAAPMAAEVLGEVAGLWAGSNWLRFATGLALGPAISLLVIGAFDGPGGFLFGGSDRYYGFFNKRCKTWLKRLKNRMTT